LEIKTFEKIYNDMKNYVIANQDRLTDFNHGSVLSSQLEAHAREMAMLYINCRVGFSKFLRGLPYSVFGFRMKEGSRASAEVVFSRPRPFSYDSIIPSGTIVSSGGLNFVTVEDSVILSGQIESSPVTVSAQDVGENFNVLSGEIKTIVSVLSADIVSVTNPKAATGGENSEDWASYTNRFADFILGLQRTNSSGIFSGLTDLIRSHGIQEHFPPLDGIWNMTLYLEDGSGGMPNEKLAEAKRIVDGNIAKRIGGFRAPGINVRYKAPNTIPVTIRVTVAAERDVANETAESVVSNAVIDEVRRFVNGRRIGENVLISDINVLLRRLSKLSNVRVMYPTEDIKLDPNTEIARYEDCIVTVEAR
jgi:uncharacterized phage protein gp47/JayE